ncbi:MAG: hypothetical protein ACREA3_02890 [Nitrosotalea sp.]
MVNLDKYRDEIEKIANEPESTLFQDQLIEHRERLLKIYGDIFGVEWLADEERMEKNEVLVDEEDEFVLQYEDEIDEIASQPVTELSVQQLRTQRTRLIEIFEEMIENQHHSEEELVDDEDEPVNDDEVIT